MAQEIWQIAQAPGKREECSGTTCIFTMGPTLLRILTEGLTVMPARFLQEHNNKSWGITLCH